MIYVAYVFAYLIIGAISLRVGEWHFREKIQLEIAMMSVCLWPIAWVLVIFFGVMKILIPDILDRDLPRHGPPSDFYKKEQDK